jgi:hypothetical protein
VISTQSTGMSESQPKRVVRLRTRRMQTAGRRLLLRCLAVLLTISGSGGVTPPGGNTGAPGSVVAGYVPDLRRNENRLDMAILVKF